MNGILRCASRRSLRLCTIPEIEQAYEISEARLMKVTHQLALQGWIVAVRCKEGGMRLAHMTQQINIDVVALGMESDVVLVEYFGSDD